MDVRKPSSKADAKWISVFYGLSDAGKTHLLGTATKCPATTPTLFVNTDQGDLTLSGLDVDVVDVNTLEEAQEVYEFLLEENTEYKSVLVDGLTAQQQDISMLDVLDQMTEDGEFLNLSESKPPTQRDWLMSQHQMRTFLRAMRQVARNKENPERRIHVFMTALEKVDDRRDMGLPALPGVLGLGLGQYVDVVARLKVEEDYETGEEVRYLYSRKHEDDDDGFVYLAKNRLRLLPRRMKNPSISKIMKRLIGEQE